MPVDRIASLSEAGIKIRGLAHQYAPVYSVEAVLTPLVTCSIPAEGLNFNGDMIDFEVYGHVAAGTGEQIKVTLADIAILDTGVIDTLVGDFVLRGHIVRAGLTTVNVAAVLLSSAVNLYHVDAGFDFDPAVTNDFVVSGLGPTANDVMVALAIVNFRGQA